MQFRAIPLIHHDLLDAGHDGGLVHELLFEPSPGPAHAAVLGGLIGNAGVIFAIGRTITGPVAAEAEIIMGRVTDGPFAGFLGQMQNGDATILWQIHQTQGLGFRQRCQSRIVHVLGEGL